MKTVINAMLLRYIKPKMESDDAKSESLHMHLRFTTLFQIIGFYMSLYSGSNIADW